MAEVKGSGWCCVAPLVSSSSSSFVFFFFRGPFSRGPLSRTRASECSDRSQLLFSSSSPVLFLSLSLCIYIFYILHAIYIYMCIYIYIYIYNSASRVLSAREKGRGGGERRWYESGGEPVGERKEERRGERSQRGH